MCGIGQQISGIEGGGGSGKPTTMKAQPNARFDFVFLALSPQWHPMLSITMSKRVERT